MSKYFKRGVDNNEITEVLEDLNSLDTKRQRSAVKRIIANMTLGKDVKGVFTDVLKCVQTQDLELKKLIYLYLINYSSKNPDATILAVNTFDNDTRDKDNPLVRALAIRTMACIRVEQITEYISEPLRRCLHDFDPFVKKTAALAVAKLFDIDPDLCVDQGFLEDLRELLTDGNQMVVSNAVAAFSDIVARSNNKDLFVITQDIINSLLNALNDANEWGQSFILDSLVNYTPAEPGAAEEAELCIERICPRLQHANPGVTLSAIRAIIHFLEFFVGNENKKNPPSVDQLDSKIQMYLRKIVPPLITLLSGDSEIVYVALRIVPILLARYPGLLSKEAMMFFPRYSDAIYVKMEKLDILVEIANKYNVDSILLELRENAKEIDIAFSRKCVKCIGKIAIAFSNDTSVSEENGTTIGDRCVGVLLRLITPEDKEEGTINAHILTECTITLCNIFRAYPNTYEHTIERICEAMTATSTTSAEGSSGTTLLDDPECLCSLVWMIGEYADRIDNPLDTLHYITRTDSSIEDVYDSEGNPTGETRIICNTSSFLDASPEVQLCIINSLVKMYLHANNSNSDDLARTQAMLQNILELATEGEATTGVDKTQEPEKTDNNVVINPDVRDRAYYYWRLLSTSIPNAPANAMPNGEPFDLCRYVVLQQKPKISAQSVSLGGMTLAGNSTLLSLLPSIGTLSSVLREPISFSRKNVTSNMIGYDDEDDGVDDDRGFGEDDTAQDIQNTQAQTTLPQTTGNLTDLVGISTAQPVQQTKPNPAVDLLSLMGGSSTSTQPIQQPVTNAQPTDLLGLVNVSSVSSTSGQTVLPDTSTLKCPVNPPNCGYQVISGWGCRRNATALILKIKNDTNAPIQGFNVKFEPNPLGISEATGQMQMTNGASIPPGSVAEGFIPIKTPVIGGTASPATFRSLPKGLTLSLMETSTGRKFMVLTPIFLFAFFNRGFNVNVGVTSIGDFERVWGSLGGVEKTSFVKSNFGASSLSNSAVSSRFSRFGFTVLGESQGTICCVGSFAVVGVPVFVLVRLRPDVNNGGVHALTRVGPAGCAQEYAQNVCILIEQSINCIMASQD